MNKILALHTSHDGSLTYVVDNEIIFHTQLDRYNRYKHASFAVKFFLDLIKSLEFDTFIVTLHPSTSNKSMWFSFFEQMPNVFKDVKIIHHDINVHHYFHACCSLTWNKNISDILVYDGTGAYMSNTLYERETLFRYTDDLNLIERHYNNIGLDYELGSMKIMGEEHAEAKTMAYSLFNKEAKAIQENFETKSINFIKSLNKKELILTGGCTQNVLLNNKLLDFTDNLFCDPFNTDAGISLGALNHEVGYKIKNDTIYLGIKQNINTDLFLKYTIKTVEPYEVAQILQEDPVAIFQSRSEQGQRGLGNRSLLMNPSHPQAQEKLNEIKKREWYRPFACSILQEEARNWFDMKGLSESPYMMYVFNLLESKKNILKSGISKNNTSRIQTVTKSNNQNYYNLIKSFYKLTNIPLVINTSLNLPGEVLVETMYDLYNLFNNSPLKYIYLPEINKIIIK